MLKQSQLDLCGRVDFTREVPLLGRDEGFSFACAGCGDCCRGREDIVLSGFDLWRIAARLRLPPRTVARAFCKASIGAVSHLPVLRLAPVPQELTKEGSVSYFLQPTSCGGQVISAKVGDYLARYDIPAREATDVRWAQVCMALEDRVEALEAVFEPVFIRRVQQKLWQALYYRYDFAAPFLPQLEENLRGLDAELEKLSALQERRNVRFRESIEKTDR